MRMLTTDLDKSGYSWNSSLPAAARAGQQDDRGRRWTTRTLLRIRRQWDGTGAPGEQDSVVDLFHGPGGVEAWAYTTPTKESLGAYAQTLSRAAAATHPCPAVPQTDQAITIGGAPARLLGMQCPPHSRFLVETAVTIHDGTALVFTSQNPTGTAVGDRAAFRKFLAGIRFQR
jgi:hypothetical protein